MKISSTDLNMYELENFYKKVLTELKKAKKSFTLNFADVEKIDLGNIQLILSVHKYCLQNDIDLKITNINSKDLKNSLKLYGVDELLGISL